MVYNIATLALCLLAILFFRRLDRSNLKLIKLRRYSDRVSKEFKRLSETETRRFNDATIEMDILVKKAGALSKNMQESLSEIESRLTGMNMEKGNLKKIEEDLQVVSVAARDVNKQIEYIAASREGFEDLTNKIVFLTENLSVIEQESVRLIDHFNKEVRMRSRELSGEIAQQVGQLREKVRNDEDAIIKNSNTKCEQLSNNFSLTLANLEKSITDTGSAILENVKMKIDAVSRAVDSVESRVLTAEKRVFSDLGDKIESLEKSVQDFEFDLMTAREKSVGEVRSEVSAVLGQLAEMKITFSDIENTFFAEIKEKSVQLKRDVAQSVDEFTVMKETLFANVKAEIDRVYARLSTVEENINDSKSRLIKSFELEVGKVRDELDSLSLHSISKKDEIIQAARREIDEVKKITENFGITFREYEKQLETAAEERLGAFGDECRIMERRLDDMHQALLNHEESQKIFTRTDEMIKRVEDSIGGFNRILKESKEEARNLEKFIDDIQKIKDLRKNAEKEIKIFETRKGKIENFEAEIQALLGLTDEVFNRAELLNANIEKVNQVDNRINALSQNYADLQARIHELQEYEDTIARNLESVERADLVIQSIESKIGSFNKTVEKADKRVDSLKKYLQSIEEKTLILKTKEQEITDVMDKFNELEGLSTHIEERIKQMQAMFKRVEAMKDDINDTDTRLQSMFSQTDMKMRQFAEFLKAIESNSPIEKKVSKENFQLGKNINDRVIKTVRDLSSKGWSSSQISKELLIDESSIRFIINSMSM